jgi:RNA polymerase sigma-70 factor (ECF subfamily)
MADLSDQKAESPADGRRPSDQSLLRRFRRGEQDGATQLYLRYAPRVRALVKAKSSPDLAPRVDADDIVQSVFRSFFQGVTHGYYDVPAGEELWKLFLVIALNKIRAAGNFHRALKRDVRLTAGGEALHQHPDDLTHDDASLAFLEIIIDETLARLPAAQRSMVEMRIEGYDVEEIAARNSRSRRTVERVVRKFRDELHALLQADT